MIRFACRCQHIFTLAVEMAGREIQCPSCGLLVDVPTLGDLPSFEDDGTIKVGESTVQQQPGRLDELAYIYAKGRHDHEGNEIDLRQTVEDYELAGESRPVKPESHRPRYDPETGELIRAFELKQDPEEVLPEAIPFAKPALSYEPAGTARPPGPFRPLIQLLAPINLLVMIFVLCMQGAWAVGMQVVSSAPVVGPILIWAQPLLQFLLLAHYGNVIDEIGPDGHDELPRVFRDLRWHEDLWGPLSSMAAAIVLCYAPVFVLLGIPGMFGQMLALFALAAATLIFPAVLLTLRTSGSLPNLRPDRLFHTARACGPAYLIAIIAWALGAVFYAASASSFVEAASLALGFTLRLPRWLDTPGGALPALALGIYFMHLCCWELGLMYRKFFPDFEWVGQYHVRDPRRATLARVRRVVPSAPSRIRGGRGT